MSVVVDVLRVIIGAVIEIVMYGIMDVIVCVVGGGDVVICVVSVTGAP